MTDWQALMAALKYFPASHEQTGKRLTYLQCADPHLVSHGFFTEKETLIILTSA